MALTAIEQIVLWGVPVLSILVTVMYYLKWGKEPSERSPEPDTSAKAGEP